MKLGDAPKLLNKRASNIVTKSLGYFSKAIKGLEEANDTLEFSVEKCDYNIESANEVITDNKECKEEAKKAIEENNVLKKKLSEFVNIKK